ncbi:hypothetical protein [Pseudaquidulcibacter saccharophilus]|uniref:hypothetical protein n=1 Tax=Pseudaquidulcibacter saccharophilus TaxID=2831900 RepID=UPI001EFF4C7B|nr:hypothetical protein [Pseudaquidulcibacter saccharophilus]
MVKTLEPGAQLAIHAIRRASLKDGASCPVNTERVIAAQLSMRAFAQILLEAGRKLNLGEVGAIDPTPDERTLLNVMSAAQNEDDDAFLAGLRWLVGREPSGGIRECARAAAASFAAAGWTWGAPIPKRTPEPPYGMKPVRPVN